MDFSLEKMLKSIFDDDAEMDFLAKSFSSLNIFDHLPDIDTLALKFFPPDIDDRNDRLTVPLVNIIPTSPVPVNAPPAAPPTVPTHIPESPTLSTTHDVSNSVDVENSDATGDGNGPDGDGDDINNSSEFCYNNSNGNDNDYDGTIELDSDEIKQRIETTTFTPETLTMLIQTFFPDPGKEIDQDFILEGGEGSESYNLFNQLRDAYIYVEDITEEEAIGLSIAYCDEYKMDDGMWYFVRYMEDTIRTWHIQIDEDDSHVFVGHIVDYVDEMVLKSYGKFKGEDEEDEESEVGEGTEDVEETEEDESYWGDETEDEENEDEEVEELEVEVRVEMDVDMKDDMAIEVDVDMDIAVGIEVDIEMDVEMDVEMGVEEWGGMDIDNDTTFTSISTNDYWSDSTLVNNDYDDMDVSEDFTVPFDDFKSLEFSRIGGGSWASARARRSR